MSLRIDNGERATLEYADIALSPTRYIASWLRQRGWRLPEYRWRAAYQLALCLLDRVAAHPCFSLLASSRLLSSCIIQPPTLAENAHRQNSLTHAC